MTAHQINDAIITRYKIGKVRINPLRIAKRLTGNESIEATYGKKGLFVYKYKK
ncbi:MAG: hypothetical protein Q8N08_02015 [Methanobacteriaceae archaeon]|nr:hypothetical protein [Methanobacteriaceae archaeon]